MGETAAFFQTFLPLLDFIKNVKAVLHVQNGCGRGHGFEGFNGKIFYFHDGILEGFILPEDWAMLEICRRSDPDKGLPKSFVLACGPLSEAHYNVRLYATV